jgi:hypothetical protein
MERKTIKETKLEKAGPDKVVKQVKVVKVPEVVKPAKKETKLEKAGPDKVAKQDKVVKVPEVVKPAKQAKADVVTGTTEPVNPTKVAKTTMATKTPKLAAKPKISQAAKPVKLDLTKPKRLSASQRIHIRRLKQAARQEGSVYHNPLAHQVKVK